MEYTLKILGISLGTLLAAWGMFHQLIVGGAVMVAKHHHPDEKEARLFVMAWVAQGGFMAFLGLVPATMLFLYGVNTPPVHTVLAVSARHSFCSRCTYFSPDSVRTSGPFKSALCWKPHTACCWQ